MVEEGNPTLLSRDPDLYNISKFQLMYRIISDFLRIKLAELSFSLKLEPLYTFLYTMPHHNEDCLYLISKRVIEQDREK